MNLAAIFEHESDAFLDAPALRRRDTVLRLSHVITVAAAQKPSLAGVLMEAFDHALEQLLLFGSESDLRSLEEWLARENA